jgi:starch synthase
MGDVLRRIGKAWHDREAWTRLMKRAMAQDFSWERVAAAYVRLYRELLPEGSVAKPA